MEEEENKNLEESEEELEEIIEQPLQEETISQIQKLILENLNSSSTNPTLQTIESLSIIRTQIKILEEDILQSPKKEEYNSEEKDQIYKEPINYQNLNYDPKRNNSENDSSRLIYDR